MSRQRLVMMIAVAASIALAACSGNAAPRGGPASSYDAGWMGPIDADAPPPPEDAGRPQGPPAPGKVYVADEESGTVSVIDAVTNERIATIELSDPDAFPPREIRPHDVQVAPDGRSVWVTAPPLVTPGGHLGHHPGEPPPPDDVVVIDPATDTIGGRIEIGPELHLAHVVLDATSEHAFVTADEASQLIRTGALTRIALPAGSAGPIQLYPTPDSRRLYVCDQGTLMDRPPSNRLYEIDVEQAIVAATIEVGTAAHGVVVGEDGRFAYVTNQLDDTVSVVDVATRTVVATVAVGTRPNGIAHWHVTGGQP